MREHLFRTARYYRLYRTLGPWCVRGYGRLNIGLAHLFVDCNGNTFNDADDIAEGTSLDENGNGVPDECECPGDLNNDQTVDLAALSILLANYGSTSAAPEDGDLDEDGDVDINDLSTMLSLYGTAC